MSGKLDDGDEYPGESEHSEHSSSGSDTDSSSYDSDTDSSLNMNTTASTSEMPSSETNVDLSVADVTSPSQAQTSGVETHAHEERQDDVALMGNKDFRGSQGNELAGSCSGDKSKNDASRITPQTAGGESADAEPAVSTSSDTHHTSLAQMMNTDQDESVYRDDSSHSRRMLTPVTALQVLEGNLQIEEVQQMQASEPRFMEGLKTSAASPNTEMWQSEVELCTASQDIAKCLLAYIERGLPLDSPTVQNRLSARVIARFCRARLFGHIYVQKVVGMSTLQALLHRRLHPSRTQFILLRSSISLLQSRLRSISAYANMTKSKAAALRLQADVRSRLSNNRYLPLYGEHIRSKHAAEYLASVLARGMLTTARAQKLSHAKLVQNVIRARTVQMHAHRMRFSALILQAVVRRKTMNLGQEDHDTSQQIAGDLLGTILELVEQELLLRQNPFQSEALGKIKATRRGGLMSRGRALDAMFTHMANLGRSMSRYLSASTLQRTETKPSIHAHLLVPDINKSDDMKINWTGGLSYDEVKEKQRKTWPSKKQFARRLQESLEDFQARMSFMRDRRMWEKQNSTSRLDPLFRTGTGAPVMRQRSTELPAFQSIYNMPSVQSTRTAPDLVRKSGFRWLPWKQEEPKSALPAFLLPSKMRKQRSAADVGWDEGPRKPASSPAKTRPMVLMHQVRRKDPAEIWEGVESTQSIREREEEEKRSQESEARALFLPAAGCFVNNASLDQSQATSKIDQLHSALTQSSSVSGAGAENGPCLGTEETAKQPHFDHNVNNEARQVAMKQPTARIPQDSSAKPEKQVQRSPQNAEKDSQARNKGVVNKAARFWGFGVGSRLFHPVNFLEIGNRNAAATTFVRATMQQRFSNVAEAYVFFDLDDTGTITRVRFERGLARMGLLDKVNPEQLWCEINGIYNGKLSKIEANDFMRHFHWGNSIFDSSLGLSMLRCARACQDTILIRGRAPPPLPPAHVTPLPGQEKFVGRQATRMPRPRTHVDSTQPRSANAHKSLADLRRIRIDKRCEESKRLSVISEPYLQPETHESPVQDASPALEKCIFTAYQTSAAFTAHEANKVNVLKVSTPNTEPGADGLPGTESSINPFMVAKHSDKHKLRRMRDSMLPRLARMSYMK